jgi:hypothetical protein
MPNGLEAGDSVKGSDTLSWLRGERAERSPGRRDVRVDDIVSYLNDPSVLTSVGGSISGDDLARVEALEKNLGVNFLRDSIAEGWSIFEMVDGFSDVFTDETGINTGSSTNAFYNPDNDYYTGTSAGTHGILIRSEASNGNTDDWSGGLYGTDLDATGARTITSYGNAQNSTTQAKFGSSSVSFDGTGDALSTPYNAEYNFSGGEDWTIEAWVYLNSTSGTQTICHFGTGTSDVGFSFYISTGTPTLLVDATGDFSGSVTATGPAISAGAWYHISAVRDGSNFYVYSGTANPTSGTGVTAISSFDNSGGAPNLYIGSRDSGSTANLNGYIEEFSILKGTARYPSGTSYSAPGAWGGVSDMTLLGASQTANSAPSNARMVILHRPIDTVTLGTDCTLEISRDGGSTYDEFTLTKEADYGTIAGGVVEILTTDDLTLAATSGTSIVYRFKTLNSKDQRLHGVYVQWR